MGFLFFVWFYFTWMLTSSIKRKDKCSPIISVSHQGMHEEKVYEARIDSAETFFVTVE